MDFWASLEHKIRYKKNLSKERLNEIDKELLECAKICKTLDEKMEEIKTKLISRLIFFIYFFKRYFCVLRIFFHEFTIFIESNCQQWNNDNCDS